MGESPPSTWIRYPQPGQDWLSQPQAHIAGSRPVFAWSKGIAEPHCLRSPPGFTPAPHFQDHEDGVDRFSRRGGSSGPAEQMRKEECRSSSMQTSVTSTLSFLSLSRMTAWRKGWWIPLVWKHTLFEEGVSLMVSLIFYMVSTTLGDYTDRSSTCIPDNTTMPLQPSV